MKFLATIMALFCLAAYVVNLQGGLDPLCTKLGLEGWCQSNSELGFLFQSVLHPILIVPLVTLYFWIFVWKKDNDTRLELEKLIERESSSVQGNIQTIQMRLGKLESESKESKGTKSILEQGDEAG